MPALEAERGVRVDFDSKERAVQFRQRCYTLRRKLRDQSRRQFAQDEPGYDQSDYDGLILNLLPMPDIGIVDWQVEIIKSEAGRIPGLIRVEEI